MPRLQIDRYLAHAAGWDAGNNSMRKAGRQAWSEEDWNAACAEFEKLWPEAADDTQDGTPRT